MWSGKGDKNKEFEEMFNSRQKQLVIGNTMFKQHEAHQGQDVVFRSVLQAQVSYGIN